jgi:osmotically-inducible protein OsmY
MNQPANRNRIRALLALALFAACTFASMPTRSALAQAPAPATGADAQIQADVTKALDNKRLRGVTAQVASGVVTLTGSVDTYQDKQDAQKKVAKVHNIASIDNRIQVAGPDVSDSELSQKLATKLYYDREGYPEHPFNAITVSVQDGTVTLGGLVVNPVDKSSAEGLVKSFPGVKNVIDNIKVAPPSPMDDRIRRAEFNAIYGFSGFFNYRQDPGNPIRIAVDNGNVTLVGVVNSQGDKEQAYIRASTVPGVFKVTNELQVAGSSEK